ncbi:neo-calmodulin-like isoform X3 [Biomphalaria glabrata]|uniref:Neo-calmodulin-like isoform X3 n=1 Tax=Biomphalaria glabrata TaxID=6526 RepID=A0A9W2Z8V9_BIOGL|nr:neo-calmodulin-like isoform X3 [Biomphalaria glabrata]
MSTPNNTTIATARALFRIHFNTVDGDRTSIIKSEETEDTDLSRKKERDSETEIKELFRIFDKNHDNTISSSELGKMLTCMGMEVSEEEVETLMKELDKNGNGKIEYREFKAFMQDEMRRSEENPEEQEKAIRMAFKVFDQNGDGVIDAAELKTAMKNLGEPLSDKELNDMMKQADIDKDGKINYEEFIRVWSKSMK